MKRGKSRDAEVISAQSRAYFPSKWQSKTDGVECMGRARAKRPTAPPVARRKYPLTSSSSRRASFSDDVRVTCRCCPRNALQRLPTKHGALPNGGAAVPKTLFSTRGIGHIWRCIVSPLTCISVWRCFPELVLLPYPSKCRGVLGWCAPLERLRSEWLFFFPRGNRVVLSTVLRKWSSRYLFAL